MELQKVKEVRNIGQSGQPDTATLLKTEQCAVSVETVYADADTMPEQENESFYNELSKIGEKVIKDIRGIVKPSTVVSIKFMCGRKSSEKSFVALAGDCLVEKFILQFTLYRKVGHDMIHKTISIDSREPRSIKNDVKIVMLIKIDSHLALYTATFSSKQKCFRVGIDCSGVALSYEYTEKLLSQNEWHKTYVGYDIDGLWFSKCFAKELDSLIPDEAHLEGIIDTMKSFQNGGMYA